MATRCNVFFKNTGRCFYRHWDGYPEGCGQDIYDGLKKIKEKNDSFTYMDVTNAIEDSVDEFTNHIHDDIDYMYYVEVVNEGKGCLLECYKCWEVKPKTVDKIRANGEKIDESIFGIIECESKEEKPVNKINKMEANKTYLVYDNYNSEIRELCLFNTDENYDGVSKFSGTLIKGSFYGNKNTNLSIQKYESSTPIAVNGIPSLGQIHFFKDVLGSLKGEMKFIE